MKKNSFLSLYKNNLIKYVDKYLRKGKVLESCMFSSLDSDTLTLLSIITRIFFMRFIGENKFLISSILA